MIVNVNVSWVKLNESELIIENSVSKTCVELDFVGIQIWETLLATKSLQETIDTLCEKYSCSDARVIKKDVISVFNTLVENDMCSAEANHE